MERNNALCRCAVIITHLKPAAGDWLSAAATHIFFIFSSLIYLYFSFIFIMLLR